MWRSTLLLLLLCPPPPTLAAFGDSITVGNLASTSDRTYAHLTADAVGLPLDNRAVSGTVVADQLETIRAYGGPATTAIWLVCANDLTSGTTAADFGRSVQAGVDSLAARGVTVYLNGACLPFPWADTSAYDAALAQIHGARLVDVRTGFDAAVMLADKKHPNDAGHAFLAGAFERAMATRTVYLPMVSGAADTPAPDRPRGISPAWAAQRSELLANPPPVRPSPRGYYRRATPPRATGH